MRWTVRSRAARSAYYRRDIDGLRAIAVVAVMLFHARAAKFQGGFVGVDIFFVISGYLITQILLRENSRGDFSIARFYARRVRRIFPALFTVVVSLIAVGLWILPPQELSQLGRTLLAVVGFVSNVYFSRGGVNQTGGAGGYFADLGTPSPLLHTWSLSLEEQFYVFFPLLLYAIRRFGRRWQAAVLVTVAATSFHVEARTLPTAPVAAFYLLQGRAWELIVGAIVALKIIPPLKSVWWRSMLGAAGLIAVLYAILRFTSDVVLLGMHFPGAPALVPCLGAALIIYAGSVPPQDATAAAGEHRTSIVASLLGLPPLVALGVVSYPLYLWHWPLNVFTHLWNASGEAGAREQVPGMLAAVVLAVATFLLMEQPLQAARVRKRTVLLWGAAVSAATAVMAAVLMLGYGGSMRLATPRQHLMASNFDRKSSIANAGACSNFHITVTQYSDVHFCEVSPREHNVLFWGDSQIGQLFNMAGTMARENRLGGRGAVFAMAFGCTLGTSIDLTGQQQSCSAISRYALQRAQSPDVDAIVVEVAPWWSLQSGLCAVEGEHCVRAISGDEAWQRFLTELEGETRTWQSQGKHVVLTVPFPFWDRFIPETQFRNLAVDALHISWARATPHDRIPPSRLEDVRRLAARTGASLFDPRQVLCHGGSCIYQVGGLSLYADDSHLADSETKMLETALHAAVTAAGPKADQSAVH